MADVAAIAGVSHQTVSRVLSGAGPVKAQTRERVLDAITELGYRPNLAARALAKRRGGSIGVLSPAIAHYGPTSILHAIESSARAAGYHPVITSTGDDDEALVAGLDFLSGLAVEGILVIAPSRAVFAAISKATLRVPIVALGNANARGIHPVRIDQGEGIDRALEHLVTLGHRSIQFLAGPEDWLEADDREAAYLRGCERFGLARLEVLRGDWTPESGAIAASGVSSQATAVLSANDQMAIGLIHELAASGRSVPEDLSVIGFDDIPEARWVRPALTTIRQDFAELGRIAVTRLMAELAGDHVLEVPAIVPNFIIRDSTAAAPR